MYSRKKNSRRHSKFMVYFPLLFFVLISVPSNYRGNCVSLRNASHFTTQNIIKKLSSIETHATVAQQTPTETSSYPSAITPFLIFLLLIFVISTVLYNLILCYFNSHSLARECVALYLYKDIVRTCMAMNCMWLMAAGIRHVSGSEHEIDKSLAKPLWLVILGTVLLFLLNLNVTAALDLYKMKKMMVDPPMLWGEDDNLGIKIIRLVNGAFVLGVIGTMYAFGVYPKVYYTYIGDSESVLDLPKGTMANQMLLVFLLTTFTIISLVSKYFQSKHQDDVVTGIPRPVYCIMWMVLMSLALLLFMEVSNALGPKHRWALFLVVAAGVNVMIPLCVILHTARLRSYAFKTLQDKIHDMLYLDIKFVFMCLSVHVLIALCVN